MSPLFGLNAEGAKSRGNSQSLFQKKKSSAVLCGTRRPQRLLLPRNQKRWGPIGPAGFGSLHMRSPEKPGSIVLQEKIHRPPWAMRRPTSIEDPSLRPATFHQDLQTRLIIMIGGENSTTILGHLGIDGRVPLSGLSSSAVEG